MDNASIVQLLFSILDEEMYSARCLTLIHRVSAEIVWLVVVIVSFIMSRYIGYLEVVHEIDISGWSR